MRNVRSKIKIDRTYTKHFQCKYLYPNSFATTFLKLKTIDSHIDELKLAGGFDELAVSFLKNKPSMFAFFSGGDASVFWCEECIAG